MAQKQAAWQDWMKDKNWETWTALGSGAALLAWGIVRRSAGSAALAGAGGILLYRGACSRRPLTGILAPVTPEPRRIRIAATILQPVETVYEFWRRLDSHPEVFQRVAAQRVNGETLSTRKLELVEERPNELLRWQTRPDAPVRARGAARFRPAPAGRGTEVQLDVVAQPRGGGLGELFRNALGHDPEPRLRTLLMRSKQLLEAGEVATTEGQPRGSRSKPMRVMTRVLPRKEKDRQLEAAV